MNNQEEYPKKQHIFNLYRFICDLFSKSEYKTIRVEHPNGWMNCGVTTCNHFVADTNDSTNWDTMKIPLPKPKYKWQIKSYGGTIGEKHNKDFVVLIDKK